MAACVGVSIVESTVTVTFTFIEIVINSHKRLEMKAINIQA